MCVLKVKFHIIICNDMLIICRCVISNPDQEDAVQQLRELPSHTKLKLYLCLCSLAFSFQVKVMTELDLLPVACEQFLGKSVMQIKAVVLQTLEGHLRSILGLKFYVFLSLWSHYRIFLLLWSKIFFLYVWTFK